MAYKHRKYPRNKIVYLDDRMMWLRLAAAVSLLALGGFVLTGCKEKAPEPAAGPAPEASVEVQPMAVDSSGTYVPEDPSMTMLLPVSSSTPAIPVAYRGDWSNDVESCGLPDGIWRFEELKTSTGRGVTCDLTGLKAVAGNPSTTLLLACNGEGMTAKEEWELSSPAEGKMNFIRTNESSTTIPLIRCPGVA